MTSDRVSPVRALQLMRDEGYVYLDVRSRGEFALGHPRGAFNLPWQYDPARPEPNPDFVPVARERFGPDAKLVVGCRTSRRSQLAAAALRAAGFRHVVEQRAGMDGTRDAFGGVTEPGWVAQGLPVATEPEPGHLLGDAPPPK